MSGVKVSAAKSLKVSQKNRALKTKRAFENIEILRTDKARSNNNIAQIEASNRTANATTLANQLLQMPEVRLQRIEILNQKIQAGEYQPSSHEIACAMLKNNFWD